ATDARIVAAAILVLAFGLGAALRLWLVFHDDGLYWPDEIFQSLEPAHRLVFGYGIVAWEVQLGARGWAFPGLIACLLKLATLVGLPEPRGSLSLVKLAFSAISLLTGLATFRLARAHGASTLAAACAAGLFLLAAPTIYFAPRALSETAAALPVVLG